MASAKPLRPSLRNISATIGEMVRFLTDPEVIATGVDLSADAHALRDQVIAMDKDFHANVKNKLVGDALHDWGDKHSRTLLEGIGNLKKKIDEVFCTNGDFRRADIGYAQGRLNHDILERHVSGLQKAEAYGYNREPWVFSNQGHSPFRGFDGARVEPVPVARSMPPREVGHGHAPVRRNGAHPAAIPPRVHGRS